MSRSKLCTLGCNRPADPSSPEGRLCTPCLTQAEWENTHSDYGHDVTGPDSDSGDEADVRARDCWICHPELDEAAKAYVPRKGVCRTGQTQIVPIKAPGAVKAEAVQKALEAIGWTGAKIATRKGVTSLRIAGANLILCWDASGAYMYGPSVFGEKKIRIAKEAVRILDGYEPA